MFLLGRYFGVSAAMDSKGKIPHRLRNYTCGESEEAERTNAVATAFFSGGRAARFTGPASTFEKFLAGRFSEMDFLNSPGGSLEFEAKRDNKSSAERYPYEVHFCTRRMLESIRKYWGALFTALGYPATSSVGHTWFTLCDLFISLRMASLWAHLPGTGGLD